MGLFLQNPSSLHKFLCLVQVSSMVEPFVPLAFTSQQMIPICFLINCNLNGPPNRSDLSNLKCIQINSQDYKPLKIFRSCAQRFWSEFWSEELSISLSGPFPFSSTFLSQISLFNDPFSFCFPHSFSPS